MNDALPHAIGPEKSVLCSIMHDIDLIDEVTHGAETFYLPAHRVLFDFLLKTRTTDLVLMFQHLTDQGLLEAVGGMAEVTNIYTYEANRTRFPKHLEELRKRYARRLAIAAGTNIVELAYDTADDSEAYLDACGVGMSKVFDAASNTHHQKTARDYVKEFIIGFNQRMKGESLGLGIPTGIPEIDEAIRGFHPEHYGIISGRTGGGKSTLGTQIAGYQALNGTRTLYIPLERSDSSVFSRLIIQAADVRHQNISRPDLHKPNEWERRRMEDVMKKIGESECFHMEKSSRELQAVLALIRRYKRKHGIEVAYVDHIGLVRGSRGKTDSFEHELRNTSNRLQEIAHELGITVVAMCQLNSQGGTKHAEAIEEDCDWNLSIVQERDKSKENYGQHLHVLVSKDSHNGNAGLRMPLILNKDTLRFIRGEVQQEPEKKKKSRWD